MFRKLIACFALIGSLVATGNPAAASVATVFAAQASAHAQDCAETTAERRESARQGATRPMRERAEKRRTNGTSFVVPLLALLRGDRALE